MDKAEVILPSFPIKSHEEVTHLLPDDLKHFTDFFSILMSIDQRITKKEVKTYENK